MTPAPQKPATLEAKIRRFVGALSIRSRVIGGVAGVLLVALVAGGVAAATRPDGLVRILKVTLSHGSSPPQTAVFPSQNPELLGFLTAYNNTALITY